MSPIPRLPDSSRLSDSARPSRWPESSGTSPSCLLPEAFPTVRPQALIYRERLLPYSETFIVNQAERCRRYQCLYVGLSAATGQRVPLPSAALLLPTLTWPQPFWKLVYRVWGWVHPVWVRALCDRTPQLIHAHFGPDGGFATSLARALKLPLIVTYHGYDATARRSLAFNQWDLLWRRGRFFKALAEQRQRVPFKSARCIIAVSQFIRQQLIEQGCPAHKIVVHYTGINLLQFRPDKTIERQRIVLFVGRLVEKKGVAVLLTAMARLQQQSAPSQNQNPVRLVIVGEGGLRSQLEHQAAALGLTHCEFLGVQTPAQVRAWMNQAWLLCAPSLTAQSGDAEGLGMAILEAQAMELPVVATRSGGIPEGVVDGETGLLVPERDSVALAEAIGQVLANRTLRDRLAQAGRTHIETHFDIAKNTPKLEAIYDRIIQ